MLLITLQCLPGQRLRRNELYHLKRGREWLLQMYRDWGKPSEVAEWAKTLATRQ